MAMSVVYTVWEGRVVSENRGGVESDYIPDPLGNTIALVSDTHSITDTWLFWPYGEIQSHSGQSTTPFAFLGTFGFFGDIANQLYARLRILRADLTLWLSADRLWPNQRPYALVGCNPTNDTDPTGLSALGDLWNCIYAWAKLGYSQQSACIRCQQYQNYHGGFMCGNLPKKGKHILSKIEQERLEAYLKSIEFKIYCGPNSTDPAECCGHLASLPREAVVSCITDAMRGGQLIGGNCYNSCVEGFAEGGGGGALRAGL
jgi:hypothetical protein